MMVDMYTELLIKNIKVYAYKSTFKRLFPLIIPNFLGDEILNVNGLSVQGLSHAEAIAIFKNIKVGLVRVTVARRDQQPKR